MATETGHGAPAGPEAPGGRGLHGDTEPERHAGLSSSGPGSRLVFMTPGTPAPRCDDFLRDTRSECVSAKADGGICPELGFSR